MAKFNSSFVSWFLSVALVSAMILFVLFVRKVYQVPFDAYTNWAMADLIEEHMDTEGKWPKSWKELSAIHAKLGFALAGHETMDSLEQKVWVDFEFDLDAALVTITAESVRPDFQPIKLKNGGTANYPGDEPNQCVFEWLKQQKFPAK